VGAEEVQLKQSEQALRNVISWRQKIIAASGESREVEVVCSGQDSTPTTPDNIQKKIIPCDGLVQGRSVYPLPKLDFLVANSILSKGHIDAVDGTQCQEWIAVSSIAGRYVQPSSSDVQEICIGVKDHLPRRVKYREAEYVFYDWKLRTTH
jgi:hypothetical protein